MPADDDTADDGLVDAFAPAADDAVELLELSVVEFPVQAARQSTAEPATRTRLVLPVNIFGPLWRTLRCDVLDLVVDGAE
ncbi:MAG TPA: hypothetical protein PKY70_10920 [Nakamurella multipartita]|nr:hypothetical protein [Nakamurella multipartita]